MLIELCGLLGIFIDTDSKWAEQVRIKIIEPGIKAIDLLLRGGPYEQQEADEISLYYVEDPTKIEELEKIQPVLIYSPVIFCIKEISESNEMA